MADLDKEYEKYLEAQYAEYKKSQPKEAVIEEIPADEPVIPSKPVGYKSYKEDIGGVTKEDIYNSAETFGDILTTLPQGITTWSDEITAAMTAGGRKAVGNPEPFSDLYEKDVAAIRQDIANARERSPVATLSGEMGAGMGTAFVPGLGAGKLVGAGPQVARGAFEGLGTAEDKASWEGATQATIGGGISGLGALVTGGFKKLTTGNPNKIRANVLGAKTSEFKEIGIKEREKIAKELKDMGLFSTLKVEFDPQVGKFIPKGKSLENVEKPVREKILERLENATKSIQDKKLQVLGKHINDPIPQHEIETALDTVVGSYGGKGTGMAERRAAAEAIKEQILIDIEEDVMAAGLQDSTVGIIEEAKNRLSADVSNYGKNPLLQKTPDSAQIYQNMYTAINQKLRKAMGNSKYAAYNEMQQKMLTAKTDLYKAIAAEDAQRAQAGWGGWFNKVANETLGSPEAGLGIANASEMVGKIPEGIQKAVRATTSELPFQVQRSLFDVSIPRANYVEEGGAPNPTGYRFQNVRPAFPFDSSPENEVRKLPGRNPNSLVAMEVAKMKLPRTTEGLIRNKEQVIAKLAVSGVPDEMIATVTQALNEDPDAVGSVAALVAMQFPTIFEKSKYKMFDGKILDPQERAKAADETSKRDDLNSLQKAKIINELNKSGKWLGE